MSYRKRIRIRYHDERITCSIYELDEVKTDAQQDPDQPTVRCPACNHLLDLGHRFLTVMQFGLTDDYDDALCFYQCGECQRVWVLHLTPETAR